VGDAAGAAAPGGGGPVELRRHPPGEGEGEGEEGEGGAQEQHVLHAATAEVTLRSPNRAARFSPSALVSCPPPRSPPLSSLNLPLSSGFVEVHCSLQQGHSSALLSSLSPLPSSLRSPNRTSALQLPLAGELPCPSLSLTLFSLPCARVYIVYISCNDKLPQTALCFSAECLSS